MLSRYRPAPEVAIVGNAGGPGILAADACETTGLEVHELSAATQAQLRSFLPGAATVTNPVDMVASASAADYRRALRLALDDDNVDAVVAIFAPPLVTQADDVAVEIADLARSESKPIVACFLGMAAPPASLRSVDGTVPSFTFPEPAVRALARTYRYAEWCRRDPGQSVLVDDTDTVTARAVIRTTLDHHPDGSWLPPTEAARLLSAYKIPVATTEFARSGPDAIRAAHRIGFPVALKGGAAELVHKTEKGAVRLSLHSDAEVDDAFSAMEHELGEEMGGAIVQPMAKPGVELIVGVVHDPSFGPMVMFGSGGTAVELFGDRSIRILPLTDTDTSELVRSLRGSPLLLGYRGTKGVDVPALEDLIARVARLAEDNPEISEMDLNPVIATPDGVVAVDVKVRIAPRNPEPDPTLRKLR